MKPFLTLILLTASALAAAERIHLDKLFTTTGKIYEQVDVSKVTELEIRFTHAGGIAAVKLSDLPVDLQQRFGYDPVTADFARINAQEERRKALIAEEQRKASSAALQAKQLQESQEISAIEAMGFMAEFEITEAQHEGCHATVYYLQAEAVKGKNGFSGQPLQQVVKRNPHGAFIHGITATGGKTRQVKLYPVLSNRGKEYATAAPLAWRVLRDREVEKQRLAAEKEQQLKARLAAADLARAERKARAEEKAAAEAKP